MFNSLPNIDPNGRYRPTEAAKLLGISTTTLWRDAKANKVRYAVRKDGGYMKFKGVDLISYWKTK